MSAISTPAANQREQKNLVIICSNQLSGWLKGWQDGASTDGIEILPVYYSLWETILFLCIPLRQIARKRVTKRTMAALQSCRGAVDLIAHGVGTDIAANVLRQSDDLPKINALILAASVLPTRFNWGSIIGIRVLKIINDCAMRDCKVLFLRFFFPRIGISGRVGFKGMIGDCLVNRYFGFGHNGYFDSGYKFCAHYWYPVISSSVIEEMPCPKLTSIQGVNHVLTAQLRLFTIVTTCVFILGYSKLDVYYSHSNTLRRFESLGMTVREFSGEGVRVFLDGHHLRFNEQLQAVVGGLSSLKLPVMLHLDNASQMEVYAISMSDGVSKIEHLHLTSVSGEKQLSTISRFSTVKSVTLKNCTTNVDLSPIDSSSVPETVYIANFPQISENEYSKHQGRVEEDLFAREARDMEATSPSQ